MTRYVKRELICANCGHQFSDFALASTNSFGGSPNLDTPSGGMARQALLRAIHVCPQCHFCSTDIQTLLEGGAAAIASQRYINTFNSGALPECCRHWSCWGQILEAANHVSQAGWAYLKAAWACDDWQYEDGSNRYRRQAIRCFQAAQASNQSFRQDKEVFGQHTLEENAILVDLFRRIRDFETATAIAKKTHASPGKPGDRSQQFMQSILQFQMHLCSIENSQPYKFSDVETFSKNPKQWHPKRWWQFWR